MRICLLERSRGRGWVSLVDEILDETIIKTSGPLHLTESSELIIRLYPGTSGSLEARVHVGDVLVASTIPQDRPPSLLELPPELEPGSAPYYRCYGHFLADWVGMSELRVSVHTRTGWRCLLLISPLYITAGKLTQEIFENLCNEVARQSTAALMDVYGKTYIGLQVAAKGGELPSVVEVQRIRRVADRLAQLLREIAHRPASRLRPSRVREPALAGQSVTDLTLDEVCVDPSLLTRVAGKGTFCEQVRESSVPNFDLAENRLLSGFLQFLLHQLRDLDLRLQRERRLRQERKPFRDYRDPEGGRTWWEQEDLPRIEELERVGGQLQTLERDVRRLLCFPFLPPAPPLRELPPATPLLRTHRGYAEAYRLIVDHFRAYRFRLDELELLTRARSLPVLYEWWCFLEVLRTLQQVLTLKWPVTPGRSSPFQADRNRLLLEFSEDQVIDFGDEEGRLVRLRYNPRYTVCLTGHGYGYGLLGGGWQRTPDMVIEVFPAEEMGVSPELLMVFDAKYTSQPHEAKLREVQEKYGKIGLFQDGWILSRQVWAMVPKAPSGARPADGDWRSRCTVDNQAFWSDHFTMDSLVTGAIQAVPDPSTSLRPLDALLRLLLLRAGVRLRQRGGA